MQNIDKIAFIAAGVLVVLGIAAAHLLGSVESTTSIEKLSESIQRKQNEQKVDLPDAPALQQEVASHFGSINAKPLPEWTWYRHPAVVLTYKEAPKEPPVHEAPALTSVAVKRDASLKRAVHVLQGVYGKVEHAKITSLAVERRKREGDWQSCKSLEPGTAGTPFDVTIDDGQELVEYQYRVTSTAESTSQIPLPDADKVLHSNESDFVLLPPNESWRSSATQARKIDEKGNDVPGTTRLSRKHFDYDKMEVKTDNGIYKEPKSFGQWRVGPNIFDSGYRIYRIEQKKDGKLVVELRDPDVFERRLELANGEAGPPLEVKEWTAPAPKETKPAEQATKPKPAEEEKKTTEGSGSGGMFSDPVKH